MTIILALDLGTTTGWAIGGSVQRSIVSGSQSFKPGRFEGGGMRYLKMRKWLERHVRAERLHIVTFEEVRRHLGVDAAHAYGGFLSTLTSWCEQDKHPLLTACPCNRSSRLSGLKGNAKKDLVIAAVKQARPRSPPMTTRPMRSRCSCTRSKKDQYLEGMRRSGVRLK
jgi:hypothetical protein